MRRVDKKPLKAIDCRGGLGAVLHAALKVGTSILFLSDPMPNVDRKPPKDGLSPVAFYLYVEDCDGAYAHAVEQGLKEVSKPEDMFWGDRTAVAQDEFGYNWTFATHIRDVSPEELEKMIQEMAG